MRVRYVVPMSIIVLFISLMPSLSHALTITIMDGESTLFSSNTLTAGTATSGYISLAGLGDIGGLTVGTCAVCSGPARVSFLDGATVDKMWLTDLALTATTENRLTGVTITFSHTFTAANSSPYPVGPALSGTYTGGTSPASSSASLTQEVWDSTGLPCIECSPESNRTVLEPTGGTSFNVSNPGSMTPGAFTPFIRGTYAITFGSLNTTVRLPGSAELIFAKGITFDEALLIQDGFAAAVPEPSSLLLLGTGLLGVAWWGLGRKRLVA